MNEDERSSDDIVVIGMNDVNLEGFLMSAVAGSDQVVAQAQSGGWWSFERPLPAVMLRTIQHWPGVFVDVGANTGFYSLLCTATDSSIQSLAFEPDPDVLRHLEGNIAINARADQIKVHRIALSRESGKATLYIPSKSHGLVETSSSLESEFIPDHSDSIDVDVSTLDIVLSDAKQISLIKVDVEGHEQGVMQGAEATLQRLRPIVAIELLDRADFAFFNELVERLGYVSYALRFSSAIRERVIEFDPEAWNHALVPSEKIAEFEDILTKLHVHLSD